MATAMEGGTTSFPTSSPEHLNGRSEDEIAAAETLLLLRIEPRVFEPRPESPSQMREAARILMNMSRGEGDVNDEMLSAGGSGDETISLRSTSGSDFGEGGSGASAGVVRGSQGSSSPSSSSSGTGKVQKKSGKKRKSPTSSPDASRSGPAKVPRVETTTRSGRKTKESRWAREGREGNYLILDLDGGL